MEWYLQVMQNYANFKGRARRTEYWMFTLFCLFFSLFMVALDHVFDVSIDNLGFGPFYIIYVVGVFLPALSATIRRLHDIGKTGWMLLLILLPGIGAIWLFLLLVKNGEQEDNKFGPCPKAET